MKVVILCGGLGTRLREETAFRPKPMVEIGGKPILWHIMKIFSAQGFNDFVLCLGYKGEMIKQYFLNYSYLANDFSLNLKTGVAKFPDKPAVEPWQITFANTGDESMTGGRLLRIREHVGKESFFMTYGDGVSDVDLKLLLKFHQQQKKVATLTAVHAPSRFGLLRIKNNHVFEFSEKPQTDDSWINGGFMVLEPKIFSYIKDDRTIFERQPLVKLSKQKQLAVHKHTGFWQCMDTPRDLQHLETSWKTGKAPWKLWKR